MPAPHWPGTQEHSPLTASTFGQTGRPAVFGGNGLALASMRAINCAGPRLAFTARISAAMPDTMGAEKLVPRFDVGLIGVAAGAGRLQAEIHRGIDGTQARARGIHAIARRRRDAHLRPQTAVAHLGAHIAQSRHGQHAGAIAGRIHGTAFIAGRCHHQHTHRGQGLDDGLVIAGTGTAAADAQVDDVRRIGIVGHAHDGQARRPLHAGDDVGIVAAALAQRPHRQQVGIPAHAGDADAIVGERAQHAHDARAMPGAVRDGAVGRGEQGVLLIGGVDPIAGIRRDPDPSHRRRWR